MWFKVKQTFGTHLEGATIELKDDGQYQILVDKGLIEETDAPKAEVKKVEPQAYSTENVLSGEVTEDETQTSNGKRGPKKKEDK